MAAAGRYVRRGTVIDSDRDLVSRLQAGDPAAFDAVHAAFHARLFGFLIRLSRDRQVAEDLAEETWVRLVARARRLRDDTQLAPWLFTVARNLYVSYCRSRLIETAHAPALMTLWPAGSTGPSPYEAAAASETERRLEAALGELPVVYREVLLLVGVEGLRPAEAAVVCGVTPEALRQRLSRARALLRQRLDGTTGSRQPVLTEVTP
jgi:RNA polymerase sigma-70 factor (ECF subfamily)